MQANSLGAVIQRMGHGVAAGVATLVARHAHAQAPQSAQPSGVSPRASSHRRRAFLAGRLRSPIPTPTC